MKKYKAIIFDFDGTLANTYNGIFNSYKYTAQQMELIEPTHDLVDRAIGSSPVDIFQSKFGLDKNKAIEATRIYRDRYSKNGIFEVELYDGMFELLNFLKLNNYYTGIATLKLEEFAIKMTENLKVRHLFDDIRGADKKDKLNKALILSKVLDVLQIDKSEALLIGDSLYDANGAKEIGVDFIAVTYGFGFKSVEDAKIYNPIFIAENPNDIINFLSKQMENIK